MERNFFFLDSRWTDLGKVAWLYALSFNYYQDFLESSLRGQIVLQNKWWENLSELKPFQPEIKHLQKAVI